jgi:NAD(P)-dependent dehydrogenase (short-subunit alcohol dehydrogenase family)
MDLEGTVALVTGGGSGMGRGTALALAAAGVDVVVADVNSERATEVAQEASARGRKCIGVTLDVNRQEDFEAARDAMLAEFGRVDIIMNNVGVIAAGLPEHIPMPEWERVISTNLLSVVRSNSVFLPLLLEQGSGHIVNTASTAGLFAYAYERLPYSATKAAVIGLSEALALYLRPRGIGVTCLCPGPVRTNIGQFVTFSGPPVRMRSPGRDLVALMPEVVGEQVVEAIRSNRFLLLTHPELQEVLIARARDPESFLDRQIAAIVEDDEQAARESGAGAGG